MYSVSKKLVSTKYFRDSRADNMENINKETQDNKNTKVSIFLQMFPKVSENTNYT